MSLRKVLVLGILCLSAIVAMGQSSMGGLTSSLGSAMGSGSQGSSDKPLKAKPREPKDTICWHGQFVGLNLVPPAKAVFSPNWGIQIQYNCNLYNRFFPVVELGYARLRETRDLADWQAKQFSQTLTTMYRGSGFYGKIGLDVPIAKKGPNANNLFFVGVRYAGATFNYEILTTPFLATYWADAYVMNIVNQHSLAHWLELVAGLRVEITPSISLGWTFTYNHLLGRTNGDMSVASYVPGYGRDENWLPTLGAWFYWHLPW